MDRSNETSIQARSGLRTLKLWSLMTLVLMMVIASGCGNLEDGENTLSARQAWELVRERPDEVVVLDVRTPEEVATGIIPGAQVINFYDSQFEARIAGLDRGRIYLVYCHSGGRSATTINRMRSLGFADVRHVGGGIVEWLREGLPLVRSGDS
ncbi:rhodanese-like domain-containing protein [Desulfovibrio ferrophilus]|uniref:Thiosulfate sulfurtransferase n=1 Tax=Desulfovibrio ferrophilus TaxID=241368 RepID=A0A2Z6AUA9_9BACT|nr:rhodanese-like domain-containing protein [Desulfovibrio ferrophilus]BBD06809.1 thiosulfate sulfurtransferase [Desulfovibrio ferrophilus]